MELNRLLRPGGYFVWSATPVYQKLPEDVEIWEGTYLFWILKIYSPFILLVTGSKLLCIFLAVSAEMKKLTKSMCWETVTVNKDKVNGVGVAVFQKPTTNECYEQRSANEPPVCSESDDPNAAW